MTVKSGVFSVPESEGLLRRAAALGLHLKVHADELTPLGGAELAARLGAASADHLLCVTESGVAALAGSPHLRNVYRLAFSSTWPGSEEVLALARTEWPRLRVFELWSYHLMDDSILHELAVSPRLPRLLILNARHRDAR